MHVEGNIKVEILLHGFRYMLCALVLQLRVHLTVTNVSMLQRLLELRMTPTLHVHVCCYFQLDALLHNLIAAMADSRPGGACLQRISSASSLCCRLTLHHPALMLRQLPMLGWVLNGRAHLRPSEFRNRNHKAVFENIFKILELLQPLIFSDSQVEYK